MISKRNMDLLKIITNEDKRGDNMIKFKAQDGSIKFELQDNGDMKFTDDTAKKEFEKKEEEVNKAK